MRNILRLLTATAIIVAATGMHPAAARAAGCGNETPLVDGQVVLRPADFTEALTTLTQNCIVHRSVVIAFPAGVRAQTPLEWHYHRPGQSILFTSAGYETGAGCDAQTDQASMATFSGGWQHSYAVGFHIGGSDVRTLNFTFYCMKLTRYVEMFLSIKARVGDDNTGHLLYHVTFDQMVFYLLGNTTQPNADTRYGRAAISTGNLGDLEVRNSIFMSLVNRVMGDGLPGPGHVHALYLRRGTFSANVHDNLVQAVSGDPFRVTNQANWNYFHHNRVLNSGEYALASDWHNQPYMHPSYYSQVHHNVYDHLYGRTTAPRMTYCYDVRDTCPEGRIQAYDNVRL